MNFLGFFCGRQNIWNSLWAQIHTVYRQNILILTSNLILKEIMSKYLKSMWKWLNFCFGSVVFSEFFVSVKCKGSVDRICQSCNKLCDVPFQVFLNLQSGSNLTRCYLRVKFVFDQVYLHFPFPFWKHSYYNSQKNESSNWSAARSTAWRTLVQSN